MLVDPRFKSIAHQFNIERIEQGVYANILDLDGLIENELPYKKKSFNIGKVYYYGVIDSLKQFKEDYPEVFSDPRPMVLIICHISKKKNETQQPAYGTWRWHKSGSYIGRGKPTTEYLNDEEHFDDGVFVYQFYLLGDNDAASNCIA